MIGRYPRYRELWERFRGAGDSSGARREVFSAAGLHRSASALADRLVRRILPGGSGHRRADQERARIFASRTRHFVLAKRARTAGARCCLLMPQRCAAGRIEISTSPFYHPILPLVCDTNLGAVSSPGLAPAAEPFPPSRGCPRAIAARACDLHQQVFGVRPSRTCGRRRAACPKRSWPSRKAWA